MTWVACDCVGVNIVGRGYSRSCIADEQTLPTFLFLRNLLGAACFFVLAIWMFGPGHFADAFSPGLWELMVFYSAIVVVLAQLSWYRAVALLPSSTVALGWTLAPIVSLLVAYFAIGEVPELLQWISVGCIAVGLAVSMTGRAVDEGTRSLTGVERSLAGAS